MEDKERSNGRKGQLSELVLVAEIIDADRSSFGDGGSKMAQKGVRMMWTSRALPPIRDAITLVKRLDHLVAVSI